MVSTHKDVSTGTIETRISKLWNQEAKSMKTVERHNIEAREMKSMVRKYQKFQNFLEDKNIQDFHKVKPQTIAIAITTNCSRRLVQEKFQNNTCRLTTRAHQQYV